MPAIMSARSASDFTLLGESFLYFGFRKANSSREVTAKKPGPRVT
jgi:hypothetical protein